NIVWLDHNEKVLNSYLKAYYQIIKWSGIEGTTIKRLYNKNILKTKICFPSIKEQKQLGILIQKLEFLITLLQRKKAKYEELKTALLQNLFPEKDSRVPLLRFKEFHNDWQQKKLETITNITMGQSPNGSTYSEIPTKYILVQGNADLKNGWVTPRIWTTQMTKQAKKGDIIFSVRAPVGKVGKTNYDVVIGRGVAAIKGNDFLFNVLKKLDKESYWDKVSSGSTFSSITSSDLKNTKIKIPQEIEQVKIGDLFFNFDETINILQKQLSKFENFKQFLLQNMFI
ncbi:restriction endonuclease subunit S, partial [Lactobacillus rodentium]